MTHRRGPYISVQPCPLRPKSPYARDLLVPDLFPSALDDAVRTAFVIVALSLAGMGVVSVGWLIWFCISRVGS